MFYFLQDTLTRLHKKSQNLKISETQKLRNSATQWLSNLATWCLSDLKKRHDRGILCRTFGALIFFASYFAGIPHCVLHHLPGNCRSWRSCSKTPQFLNSSVPQILIPSVPQFLIPLIPQFLRNSATWCLGVLVTSTSRTFVPHSLAHSINDARFSSA